MFWSLLGACLMSSNPVESTSLWSVDHRQQIEAAIEAHKEQQPYAVFDADNTIWKYDITEGLLAWLSVNGSLSLSSMPQEIFAYPATEEDTLFSYYERMCDIDHSVCYLWAAQAFAGYTLAELKAETEKMMASTQAITVPMPNGASQDIPVPQIFPAQRELIQDLQAKGVKVWVVSASPEEIVRFVVANPEYGIALPPEQVIGVNLMLTRPNGEVTVGALERQSGKSGLDHYFSEQRLQATLGTVPFAPLPWYGGKVAAIQQWITPAQRPILVAGDSPNDFYMQFFSSAIRLRIHRNDSHKQKLSVEQNGRVGGNTDPTPTNGWIEVTAAQLGVNN